MYDNCLECTLSEGREGTCGNRGPENAEVVLVGEAPGWEEVQRGLPFVGKAGKFLERLLLSNGIDIRSCLVTNVCHCRPLSNRTPKTEEMKACRAHFLAKDIAAHPRKVIVAMGNCGYYGVFPKGTASGITKRSGIWEWSTEFDAWVVPCIHPAGGLRNPHYVPEIAGALATVAQFLRGEYDPQPEEVQVQVVNSLDSLAEMVAEVREHGECSFDIETTGYDFQTDKIICISICTTSTHSWVVPTTYYSWEMREEKHYDIGNDGGNGVDPKKYEVVSEEVLVGEDWTEEGTERRPYWKAAEWEQVRAQLCDLLADSSIKLVAHNAMFDMSFLAYQWEATFGGLLFDTMLAHHLLDENSPHGLKPLACRYTTLGEYDRGLDEEFTKIKRSRIAPIEKHYGRIPPEILFRYAGLDTYATLQLKHIFYPRLQEEGLIKLYYGLTIPLQDVLRRMEMRGIKVDEKLLLEYQKEWASELDVLREEVQAAVGFELNINSHPQLAQYFFGDKKYEPLKLTTTGRPSTDEESLKYLAEKVGDPAAVKILQYKKIYKLYSTYVNGILNNISSVDSRLHTRYLVHGTVSGRLSSQKPNLQNIPRASHDDVLAGKLKKMFVAEEGYQFVEMDYGQLEIRVWGHYADDPILTELLFADDIHSAIASEVYQKSRESITKEERVITKALVFGVLYGRGPKSVSEEFGWSIKKAQQFITDFFNRFPKAKEWLDMQVTLARTRGYVANLFGRRRRLPDMHSSEESVVAQAERQAVNSPIQGGAADITNAALVRLDIALEPFRSHALLQVHDSIMCEVAADELAEVIPLMRSVLETAPKGFRVPLIVEAEVGSNWGEMKEWHEEASEEAA